MGIGLNYKRCTVPEVFGDSCHDGGGGGCLGGEDRRFGMGRSTKMGRKKQFKNSKGSTTRISRKGHQISRFASIPIAPVTPRRPNVMEIRCKNTSKTHPKNNEKSRPSKSHEQAIPGMPKWSPRVPKWSPKVPKLRVLGSKFGPKGAIVEPFRTTRTELEKGHNSSLSANPHRAPKRK